VRNRVFRHSNGVAQLPEVADHRLELASAVSPSMPRRSGRESRNGVGIRAQTEVVAEVFDARA